jgi:uncharacterized membrane protein YphA (DoxX/SURF4 family)
MKRLVEVLDRWWFPIVSPTRLAVIRILTGAFAVWYISRRGQWLDPFEGKSEDLFVPIGLTTLLDGPLPAPTVEVLGVLTMVFGVLFVLGFWWRVSGPAFAALLMFTFTYKNSWGMLFHTENMLAIHILVLGCMPSATTLALDPLIRKKWSSPLLGWLGFSPGSSAAHWKVGSAIRMLQLGTTLPYVVAGFAKVLGAAGWGWAAGTNLREQVAMNGIWYAMTTRKVEAITFYIYDFDWPWTFMAVVTLVAEFGAPLAMLHRRIGYVFVAMVLGLHWGIDILMGIGFKYQMCGLAFACFFEWERLGRWVSPKCLHVWEMIRRRGT